MEAGIIDDDDITRLQLGQKTLLQPQLESVSVARAGKRHWGKNVPLLECRNPTNALSTFARFERLEALPDLAVAIGIILSIIDACFINVYHLSSSEGLQSFLKFLTLEVIPFSIAVGLFFRLNLSLRRASLMFC